MAGFAGSAIAHGIDGAGALFGFCKLFRWAAIVVCVVDGTPVQSPEVVGGFETTFPCFTVHEARCPSIGFSKPEVCALRLVQPLLADRGALKNPRVLDFESGFVQGLEFRWDTVDMLDRAVEVLQIL